MEIKPDVKTEIYEIIKLCFIDKWSFEMVLQKVRWFKDFKTRVFIKSF